MKLRVLIVVLLAVTGLFGYRYGLPGNKGPKTYVSNFENVLGTSFEMKVNSSSEDIADQAETVALAEIDRLSKILSGYDPSSEFSIWQTTQGVPVPVSKELFEVLELFDTWRQSTNGGLDASVQVISLLWKEAAVKQQMPSRAALETVVEQAQKQHWTLDPVNQTATHLSRVPLMTNTFVKSYIIKTVAEKVKNIPGVNDVLVNIGGDIVLIGNDLNENINIADPLADAENDLPLTAIRIENKAIATSGNYRRGVRSTDNGFRILLIRETGLPADNVISATVVADKATDAGALATAFNVLEPAEAKKLAATIPGVEYMILTKDGERILSSGWHALEINRQAKTAGEQSGNEFTSSNDVQESATLTINLELNTFEGRFRRPFVAVWIENNKKETVRTVALWFNKHKWLPDLKSWYHKNYSMYNTANMSMSSISSATRPPGAYALKWDMKDDKGNPVPPGKYTVYIEAAREHGTYQIIKQEIECKNKSQVITLKGNVEIAAASLEYTKNGK